MKMIPDYIDCKKNKEVCDWYLHKDCPDTCPYSAEIYYGIGAADVGIVRLIEEEKNETKKTKIEPGMW